MSDALRHRGPDAEGFWTEPGVGLVHRRLSIIDVAGGDQPIGNEDGSIQAVFNGEIYNFQHLRARLEREGHRFKTRTDTEVLVHLYEEEGPDLVERLRGMFAFAIWDRRRRRLLLARDRVGLKPLYVCRDGERLVFGSELKAILTCHDVDRDVDAAALEDFLAFGMVCSPRSVFRSIQKLPAAHVLVVEAHNWLAPPRRYWQLRVEPDDRPSLQEWQEEIRGKVRETVRIHLVSDVPVGAFLSGGMDSTIVVGSATGQTTEPLRTFSIGFREEAISELPYASEVARRYGTQHLEEIATPDAVSIVDQLVHHCDEPFADSSAIPTYLVSQLASRHVKVVLSGDGGDEAFGGYTRYAHDLKEAAIRQYLPGWIRSGIAGRLAQIWPKADWLAKPLRAKTLLHNVSVDPARAYANTLSVCRLPLRRQLMARDIADQLNGYDPAESILAGHAMASNDSLAGMISADIAVLLPDDYLVKVDRASMAHGLEVRPPLLDHELLELAARIPSRWKIRGGQTKWILKETFRDVLPPIVQERRKQGFEIPLDLWFRGELRDRFEGSVLCPNAAVTGLIDQTVARRVFTQHLAGTARNGNILWSLYILARWSNRYL